MLRGSRAVPLSFLCLMHTWVRIHTPHLHCRPASSLHLVQGQRSRLCPQGEETQKWSVL